MENHKKQAVPQRNGNQLGNEGNNKNVNNNNNGRAVDQKPLNAEQICELLKENPDLVDDINEVIIKPETTPPAPAVDDDEPTESSVRMLRSGNIATLNNDKTPRRRVILVRAAENVDRCLPGWQDKAFIGPHKQLNYAQIDLNLPTILPFRPDGARGFVRDPPTTATGRITAQLLGRTINDAGYKISRIVSSPALHCLQTANALQPETAGDGQSSKIDVEPGLLDHLPWYDDFDFPRFASLAANREEVFNADYHPVYKIEDMRINCSQQTINDTISRICKTISRILRAALSARPQSIAATAKI